MTIGNDEQEPLISSETEQISSNRKNERNGNISNKKYQEDVSIEMIKSKTYGTLSQINGRTPNLTYTWHGIDIFGETPPHESCIKRGLKRLKSCLTGSKREPIPRKHLLKNSSGIAHGGEILAVLGSSGAGKTTLLNALAFRSPPGVKIAPSAVRAINGIPVTASELRGRCAYVQQDDLFIGSLTAKEHLIFQAILRMDRSVSYKQKLARVDEVISELSLGKCQNTIIGVPGRVKGLSGGERKRLAFASEALTDPPILFCDEPTSGLDSFMAHSVVQVLKGLASKGKTIILTIHQPSSEIYGLFDKLLLMAEGRVAFLGSTKEASEFFAQLGVPCPPNYNPADFYVQILAIAPTKEDECRETIQKICDNFLKSRQSKDIEKCSNIQVELNKAEYIDYTNGGNKYKASRLTQFKAILWRSWVTVLKEPMLVKVRIMQTTMVALLIGIIFYGQQLDQDGVMNINGALFLFLTNMTFQNVFAVINVFCMELPVFLRESRSRLYSCETYFLGKTLAELPLFLIIPILFTSIVYPMIGLQWQLENFLIATVIVSLVANVSTSFGYFISCASSSISMALSIGPPIIIPFLLFGGFFLNSGSVPWYFKWLSYLSWFKYGNEALLINQWQNVKEGEINCNKSIATCPTSGHVILETYNFQEENLILDICALCGLIILFRICAYISLLVKTRSKE